MLTIRPSTHLRAGRRALTALLAAAWLAAACGGSSSSAPNGSAGPSVAGSSGASIEPSTAASEPAASEPSASGGYDFSKAADNLSALDSYKFDVRITSVKGTTSTSTFDEGTTEMSGTVVNAGTKASSLHLKTTDKNGTVTDETEIVIIDQAAYLRSGGASSTWQQVPAAQAGVFVQSMASFRPEQLFSLYFIPIGTDNTTVGDEQKNGVATTHYKGGEDIGTILGAIAGVQGAWTSDLWIAKDGEYLVASEAGVQASSENGGGSFSIVVDVTDANSADNTITPPA